MADLTDFISARLDEDEAAANGLWFATRIPDKVPDFTAAGGPAAEAFWEHYDPARVLREVAAKRRILDERWGGPDHHDMWLAVVGHLAGTYSDHPDYDPAWAPDGNGGAAWLSSRAPTVS